MNPSQDDLVEFGVESFDDVSRRYYESKRPSEPVEQIQETQIQQQAPQKKSYFQETISSLEPSRQIGRTGSRIAETLLGLPGDVREVSKYLGEWLGDSLRSIVGKEPLTEEQRSEFREMIKPSKFDLVGQLVESLPTSQDVREGITRKYTGDWLEPQNEKERFADSVAQDFAALAIPIKGKPPFARALGQSIIANSGAEVAREFGGDKAEAYTKMGLLFGMGLLSGGKKGGVKKYINGLYDEMEQTIPQGAQINAQNLAKDLDSIEAVLRKGDPGATSKQQAFKKISAIKDKIKSGTIDVDELVQFNKDINESIFELGELRRGENQLYKIRESVHSTLGDYGKQNPDFIKSWKKANEAYAATETSRKIGDWVRKNVSLKDYAYAASALGLEGYALGAPTTLATLGTGAALGATAYTAEIMKRIAKSPALRQYYTNVVTNSLNQNKAGLTRSMKQLNKALEDSFKNEPFETVEFKEEVEKID